MGFYRDGVWQPDATEIASGECISSTGKADISGADLAIKVDEMQKQKVLIKKLGDALVEAWPNIKGTDFSAGIKIRDALYGYRDYLGGSETPPALQVGEFNPWSDTIVIEGVTYKGDFFRNKQIFNEG